jgi:predicted  nucleic acid-binding Zn-ribbon protein
MPNKCTQCGKIHPDKADYLLEGCDECGSRFFFYVKEEALKEIEKEVEKISKEEMKEIEHDVREIAGDEEETVILDLEAIRVVHPGKYKIDVTNLFNQKPLVIRTGAGKYKLDLSTLIWRRKQ